MSTLRRDEISSRYKAGVTESQKSQWRRAEYCASVKVVRPDTSWISQAGASLVKRGHG